MAEKSPLYKDRDNYVLKMPFDDLNKIGEVLGQIMERKFIKGEYECSIRLYEEDDRLTYGNGECELKNLD